MRFNIVVVHKKAATPVRVLWSPLPADLSGSALPENWFEKVLATDESAGPFSELHALEDAVACLLGLGARC